MHKLRALVFITVLMCACNITAVFAQNSSSEGGNVKPAEVQLFIHNGMWDTRDFTMAEDEYFHTLQLYSNGEANFAFCFKGPEHPYSSPVVAEYYGPYFLNGNEITLALTLKDGAKLDLPAKVNARLLAANEDDSILVLTLLEGDAFFSGIADGQKARFRFYRYP